MRVYENKRHMPWNYHIICVRVQKWSQAKGCSVTTSKRKEEITIKPKKLNLQTLAGIPAGEQPIVDLKFGLSCCFCSRQCRAVRNKSFHKSDSCCFQVQLLSPCHLLLQTGREQLPLLLGIFTAVKTWLNWGSLCVLTHWHSQQHRNTSSLYKSSIKRHRAWASLI